MNNSKLTERRFLYYDSLCLSKNIETIVEEEEGTDYIHPIKFFELIRGMEYIVDGERKIKGNVDTNCDIPCSIFPTNTLKILGLSWKIYNVAEEELLKISRVGIFDMYVDRVYQYPLAAIYTLPNYFYLGEGLNVGFGGAERFYLNLIFEEAIRFKTNPYFRVVLDCVRGFETR